MKIFRGDETDSQLADPNTFVGEAQVKRLAGADDGVPVVVYRVEFEDGGRTNWHVHSGAQWLMILDRSREDSAMGRTAARGRSPGMPS